MSQRDGSPGKQVWVVNHCFSRSVWLSTAISFISYLYVVSAHAYILRPGPTLGWSELPLLAVESDGGGSARPQAARWVRPGRHVVGALTQTHAWHICAHTRIPSDNNSLASLHFFARTVITVITAPLWITVRAHTHSRHKDTHSHSRWMLLTLSTSASVFLFFFHLPCYWWIPDMTEPPLVRPPVAACQPGRQYRTGHICLYKEAAPLHPSSLPHSLSLLIFLPVPS